MAIVKYDEKYLKIINNENEKLDIDLYIYATCTRYIDYLNWIYYFNGLISQEHLEKFVERRGTSYREDLIELEKTQIIKKFDLGKYKLIALTKRSFQFLTQKKTKKYIRKPNHSQLYKNLYLADYLVNNDSKTFSTKSTFEEYQNAFENTIMKELIQLTHCIKNDDIDVVFTDMIKKREYYAFGVFEKRETALKSMKTYSNEKHTEKIKKLHKMNILTKLKHKKIYTDNARIIDKVIEIDFIFLDNSSSLVSIRKKTKYIDLLMFELNNYALTDEKIIIKSHIKIITKNEENKLRLSRQIKKIEYDFRTKRNNLIESSSSDKMQLYNIRLNLNATFYIASMQVKTHDTERFFRTESDKIKHHDKISTSEIISSDEMLKKIEKNREDRKQKEIEKDVSKKNISQASRNILNLLK